MFGTQKHIILFLLILFCTAINAVVPTHGSMIGFNIPFYTSGSYGGIVSGEQRPMTVDYKIVTIGSKSWIWNKINGHTLNSETDYTSQARYWNEKKNMSVLWMTERDVSEWYSPKVWGSFTTPIPSPVKLSFFHDFYNLKLETPLIDYNPSIINKKDSSDLEIPTITSIKIKNAYEYSITLLLSGTDNSTDLFYLIEWDNGLKVSFNPEIRIADLLPNKTYSFTITPIDFNGNAGAPQRIEGRTLARTTSTHWINENFNRWETCFTGINVTDTIYTSFPDSIPLHCVNTSVIETVRHPLTPYCENSRFQLKVAEKTGYVEFTVPNAEIVVIGLKGDSPYTSESFTIYKNNEVIGTTIDKLGRSYSKAYTDYARSKDSITYKIVCNKGKGIISYIIAKKQDATSTPLYKNTSSLFIGNSYTAYFNMPKIVVDMAQSTGDTLEYTIHAVGGASLQNHYQSSTAIKKIQAGGNRFLILQEHSLYPSKDSTFVMSSFYPYAKKINDMGRFYNPSAETVLYMTWGRMNGDESSCPYWPPTCTYESMDDLTQKRYMMLADTLNAAVSPVGAVRRYIREHYPHINLYAYDGSHPTPASAYLAACCFYTVFFQKDPTYIPYEFRVDKDEASLIKKAVKEVLYNHFSHWHIKTESNPSSGKTVANFKCRVSTSGSVSCENTSENAKGYYWNFGDGFTTYEQNPSHSYNAEGTFTITLIASGSNGRKDTTTQTITLDQNYWLNENFSQSQQWQTPHIISDTTWTFRQNAIPLHIVNGKIEESPKSASYLNDYSKYRVCLSKDTGSLEFIVPNRSFILLGFQTDNTQKRHITIYKNDSIYTDTLSLNNRFEHYLYTDYSISKEPIKYKIKNDDLDSCNITYILIKKYTPNPNFTQMRSLFLGDQITKNYQIPEMTALITTFTGDQLSVDICATDSLTFKNHTTDSISLKKIMNEKFDCITLQENNDMLTSEDDRLESDILPHAQVLDQLIKAYNPCSRISTFLTWGYRNEDDGFNSDKDKLYSFAKMDSLLTVRSKFLSQAFNWEISPVGAVWKFVNERIPEINLYEKDGITPSKAGLYASVCTFYTLLFQKDPHIIPIKFSLPEPESKFIKRVVKEIVYDNLSQWNIGTQVIETQIPTARFKAISSNTDLLSIDLQNNSTHSIGYMWDFGDGTSSFEKNPTHQYLKSGEYTIKLNAISCNEFTGIDSTIVMIGLSGESLNKWEQDVIINNQTQTLTIGENTRENLQVSIYDQLGRIFYQETAKQGYQTDLSIYPRGLFFIRISGSRTGTHIYKYIQK